MNWNDALRELHNIICDLYKEPGLCHHFASRAGLDIGHIVLEGLSTRHQWQNVLIEAQKTEKLQSVVELVSFEYNERKSQIFGLWELYQQQISIVRETSASLSMTNVSRFKYSCFISCFHCSDQLTQRIVRELYTGLSMEINAWRTEGVYLDQNRLTDHLGFSKDLAANLCQSACMVVIYTPKYFHFNHIYCAREYQAMELLEEKRFNLLSLNSRKEQGFIIPVVFRGELPNEIRKDRRTYDFNNFLMSSPQMYKDRQFSLKIKEIAEYINDRCDALEEMPEEINLCDGFNMPQDNEALTFLSQLTTRKRGFPLR